ncbi:MAG TPA: helix-turn-helix domain-containing protein [Victivallales bacterium]|nr:helix-turn-helix domain-containing protein [Victivallales bacterium]
MTKKENKGIRKMFSFIGKISREKNKKTDIKAGFFCEFDTDWIEEICIKFSITRTEFASRLGTSLSVVRNWENGKSKPSTKYITRLRLGKSTSRGLIRTVFLYFSSFSQLFSNLVLLFFVSL